MVFMPASPFVGKWIKEDEEKEITYSAVSDNKLFYEDFDVPENK